MPILKFLKDNWVLIAAVATGLMSWGHLSEQVAQAEEAIEVISKKVEYPHPVTEHQIERLNKDVEELRIAVGRIQLNIAAICVATKSDCRY